MTIIFTVTNEQANYIFSLLDERPRKESNALFNQLMNQAERCIQDQQAKESEQEKTNQPVPIAGKA